MPRSIVYVGGAGRHLMNQSAALVADRIARSLQDHLHRQSASDYSWRVFVTPDAHQLAPGVTLDVASIKVQKDTTWHPVLDILEVRYIDRYLNRFAELSPLGRAAQALLVIFRFVRRSVVSKLKGFGARTNLNYDSGFCALDRFQATWLSFAATAVIGSVAYWIVVGLIAIYGAPSILEILATQDETGSTNIWDTVAVIAGIFGVAAGIRKPLIGDLEKDAIDFITGMEHQVDEYRFLTTKSAILDAIVFADQQTPGKVDLLTFSLGALITADAIFPQRDRDTIWSPIARVGTWITAGFPFDIVKSNLPNYFDLRQSPTLDFDHWINIVVKDDLFGTRFDAGDQRGVRLKGCGTVYKPHSNPDPLLPYGRIDRNKVLVNMFLPMRRLENHRLYWHDEDPRARTCFAEIVKDPVVGWADDILEAICHDATMVRRQTESQAPRP